LGFVTDGMLRRSVLIPAWKQSASRHVKEGLVGSFGAARVLLAGVDVVSEFVDDVTSAGTHTPLTSERHQLIQWHPQELTEP